MLIFAYIIGVLTLSSMIVITYTHKYKKKNEILPILSVFVFLLLGKVMRVLFEFNFIKIILLSSLYLFLLALGIRKFSSNNKQGNSLLFCYHYEQVNSIFNTPARFWTEFNHPFLILAYSSFCRILFIWSRYVPLHSCACCSAEAPQLGRTSNHSVSWCYRCGGNAAPYTPF